MATYTSMDWMKRKVETVTQLDSSIWPAKQTLQWPAQRQHTRFVIWGQLHVPPTLVPYKYSVVQSNRALYCINIGSFIQQEQQQLEANNDNFTTTYGRRTISSGSSDKGEETDYTQTR